MKSSNFAQSVAQKAAREAALKKECVDLHMHSTFSDGGLPVKDLIDYCALQGLTAIAVTDHDNIDSYEEGREHAQAAGVEFVTGVEISSFVDGSDIHILGYLFDPTHLKLNKTLLELRDRRRFRAVEIVRRLDAIGIHINLDRILEKTGNGSVGRAHIATQMVEEEYVSSFQEAFNRYLGSDADLMDDVEAAKLTPRDAIQLIIEAGGIPVMAHPSKTARDDLIQGMVEDGLMGIETWCHGQSHATYQRYRDIARRYDLVCCGGADFHVKREDGRHAPGSLNVPYSVLDRLRDSQVTRIK